MSIILPERGKMQNNKCIFFHASWINLRALRNITRFSDSLSFKRDFLIEYMYFLRKPTN